MATGVSVVGDRAAARAEPRAARRAERVIEPVIERVIERRQTGDHRDRGERRESIDLRAAAARRAAVMEPEAGEPVARPVLPWPYLAVLLAEVVVLGGLAAASRARPPWTYELGWAGCGSMLVMQLYSVRRRVRALRELGALRTWLDAHVFLGLQGFVLVAYHSIGVSPSASLAAINFALVATVVVTGLVGRYLYSLIPQVRASELRAYAELGPAVLGGVVAPPACGGLWDLIALDVRRRRRLRRLRRDPGMTRGRVRDVRRSIALASRIAALEVADRWFARWILLHRPLALVLLATTALHVLAHFAYAA